MSINAFEGARRIAKLVAALWIALIAGVGYFEAPSPSLHYSIAAPSAAPVAVSECGSSDAQRFVADSLAKFGAHISLCFPPLSNQNRKIAYKAAETSGMWYVDDSYSANVSSYMAAVETAFQPPPGFREALAQARNKKLLQHWTFIGQLAGGGLIALLFATVALGWIIRGFLGIPRGQDRKNSS